MELLMCLLIPVAAYVLGKALLMILYGKKHELMWQDYFIVGGIVILGLAEAANVLVAFLGCPLSWGIRCFFAALAGLVMFAMMVVLRNRRKSRDLQTVGRPAPAFVFGVLVILQVVYIAGGRAVYHGGDMTMETVQSFLATDAAYMVNPMTGQAYDLGMPARLKLLCLPTLYAMLSSAFHVEATYVVWVFIPLLTLFGCYLVYSILGAVLFKENRQRKLYFMILVALLIWVGDYMLSVDGFNLLHAGYRGVSIRGAVLVPYTVSLILRKKYKPVILCVLAEACIVWTLYGMGVCLLVAVLMVATDRFARHFTAKEGGKEGEAWSS